jgi:hypothetical protein
VALVTNFVFVPYLRKKIDKEFELETLDSEFVDDKNIQKGRLLCAQANISHLV